jgi:phosphatidate cytidylyltransferase
LLIRVFSALTALPAVLWLIYSGGWWFGGFVLIVGAICLYEFMQMTLPRDVRARAFFAGIGVLLMFGIVLGGMEGPASVLVLGFLPIVSLVFFLFRPGDLDTVAARAGLSVAGLLWAGALLSTMVLLRQLPHGGGWVMLALTFAWGSDTGAYFGGRAFGRTPLYPKVSPKKTWEGSAAGVVAAVGIAFLMNAIVGPPNLPLAHLAPLAAACAVVGQIGDLVESLVKRSVGVKDSGTIMPGHGGLLDRVDALLFVGPTVYAYAVLVVGLEPSWLPLPR